MVVFVDDFSRFGAYYFIKLKSSVNIVLNFFIVEFITKAGHHIRELRT